MHSVMGVDHGVGQGRVEESVVLITNLLRNIRYQSSAPKVNMHSFEPRWSAAGDCKIMVSMENRSIAMPSLQHRRPVMVAAQGKIVDLLVHVAVMNR